MMSQGRCRLLPAAGLVQAPSCGDQRTIQEVVVMMCINTDLIDTLQPVGLEYLPTSRCRYVGPVCVNALAIVETV